jgi:hypothetical protein
VPARGDFAHQLESLGRVGFGPDDGRRAVEKGEPAIASGRGQGIDQLDQGRGPRAGIGDRLGHPRRLLGVGVGHRHGDCGPDPEFPDLAGEARCFQLLQRPRGIDVGEGLEGIVLGPIIPLRGDHRPDRVHQPSGHRPRLLQGDRLGEDVHRPRRPLAGPDQLGDHVPLVPAD